MTVLTVREYTKKIILQSEENHYDHSMISSKFELLICLVLQ